MWMFVLWRNDSSFKDKKLGWIFTGNGALNLSNDESTVNLQFSIFLWWKVAGKAHQSTPGPPPVSQGKCSIVHTQCGWSMVTEYEERANIMLLLNYFFLDHDILKHDKGYRGRD
jgi:hypothetical protein